jgi:hypothetical protein
MGDKYIPSIKDMKANQRYHQKHTPLPKSKKTAENLPKKKK